MQKVQVLMSTYNGEKYLKEQIDSILAQECVEVNLIVRDDGSKDKSVEILREYHKENKITLFEGENIGYRKSFLWLLDNAPESEFYAFADQDDVWQNDKIISAVRKIQEEDSDKPILYTSALTCVDAELNFLREQNFDSLKLNIYSEVVRHRFAGCTYLFNKKLRDICVGLSTVQEMKYGHDGYLSLMCWFSGGKTIYDSSSHILFRRHGDNASVDGLGTVARIKKEFAFLNKLKCQKSDVMQVILSYKKSAISSEFMEFAEDIASYRSNRKAKHRLLRDKRLDCGIRTANILFKFSILIGCM